MGEPNEQTSRFTGDPHAGEGEHLSSRSPRQRAMAAFARAPAGFLEEVWKGIHDAPDIRAVRGPEIGLVMLRGRTGGGGAPFNLGEASVTRASVGLERSGVSTIGHAMVLGRDTGKARHAAAFDALWQIEAERSWIEAEIIAPIEALLAADDAKRAEETEATRVDFFTMVRGDN